MNNNTPGGAECSNAANTVNDFAAASNLTGTPTNNNNDVASPSGGAASYQSDSAMGGQELPQPADTDFVMFNEPPSVPAPNHSGWDEQQTQ